MLLTDVVLLSYEECLNPNLIGVMIYLGRCDAGIPWDNDGHLTPHSWVQPFILTKAYKGSMGIDLEPAFYVSKECWSDLGTCLPFILKEDYARIFNGTQVQVSNTGRESCYKCGCTTEKRRDFNDFSIREFCPRCKI